LGSVGRHHPDGDASYSFFGGGLYLVRLMLNFVLYVLYPLYQAPRPL
jgi:hypothetical protein